VEWEPAEAIVDAEQRIADRLPILIDRLFELAEGPEPNLGAIKYLVDRVMGKPPSVHDLPPATGCTDQELVERAREVLGEAYADPGSLTAPA
jgi:hypothetical protein